jgi:hypothetical protein
MEKLQKEYQAVHEDIMKKRCYCRGLMQEIERTLGDYYSSYNGKFYEMCLDENGKTVKEARISGVKTRSDYDSTVVTIKLAGCPKIAQGSIRLTKKEQELMSKAQKIWNENKAHSWFDKAKDFERIGQELYMLKNSICIFDDVQIWVYEDTIYNGKNFCSNYVNISNRKKDAVLLGDYYNEPIY